MSTKLHAPGRIKCPLCGYVLLGLPETHACPECGFEYDPSSVVIRLNGRGLFWGITAGVFAVVGLLITLTSAVAGLLMCALGLLALAAVSVFLWFRPLGMRRLIIVDAKGVRLRRPKMEKHISWADFGEAHVSILMRSLIIRGRDSSTLLRIRRHEFGSLILMHGAAEKMNRLARVYASGESE